MYDVKFRKLVLRMLKSRGVVETSRFTSVSRTTLWRWKRYGVQPTARRPNINIRFEAVKQDLLAVLNSTPCASALQMTRTIKERLNVDLSVKTMYKYIRACNYSRKRSRWRGQSSKPADQPIRQQQFRSTYLTASARQQAIVSIDECGFSERVKPVYGYSPVGQPLIQKISGGGWTNHSLLLAVFSDGRKAFVIKKGAMKRQDVAEFIEALPLDHHRPSILVLDNASIHKNIAAPAASPATLCFTPPYSPECNAVELCFANIKHRFRKENDGRTPVPTLIEKCVNMLSEDDILACFRHVGRFLDRI